MIQLCSKPFGSDPPKAAQGQRDDVPYPAGHILIARGDDLRPHSLQRMVDASEHPINTVYFVNRHTGSQLFSLLVLLLKRLFYPQ